MEKKDYSQIIPHNITTILKSKGFKQSFIANKAGFSEKQFVDMLHNRKIIRAEYIPKIASALEVTPDDLFRQSEKEAG